MDNNQSGVTTIQPKYNPFKDGSFWTALIIGLIVSAQSIIGFILTGRDFLSFISMLVFLLAWTGWIVFKKGRKWSLLVGLLIALILLAGFFVLRMTS